MPMSFTGSRTENQEASTSSATSRTQKTSPNKPKTTFQLHLLLQLLLLHHHPHHLLRKNHLPKHHFTRTTPWAFQMLLMFLIHQLPQWTRPIFSPTVRFCLNLSSSQCNSPEDQCTILVKEHLVSHKGFAFLSYQMWFKYLNTQLGLALVYCWVKWWTMGAQRKIKKRKSWRSIHSWITLWPLIHLLPLPLQLLLVVLFHPPSIKIKVKS